MEILIPREPWRQLPEGSVILCNATNIGWSLDGGCGKRAAYELKLPGCLTPRNCLEHHQEMLKSQERTGKIQWIEMQKPDGTIEFRRHDPYKDHGTEHW